MTGYCVRSTVVVVHEDGQFTTVAVVPLRVIVVTPVYALPWVVASVNSCVLLEGGAIVGAFGTAVPFSTRPPQLSSVIVPLLLFAQMSEGLFPGAALSILSLALRPNVGEPLIRYWSWVYIGPLITSPLTQLMLQLPLRPLRRNTPQPLKPVMLLSRAS